MSGKLKALIYSKKQVVVTLKIHFL